MNHLKFNYSAISKKSALLAFILVALTNLLYSQVTEQWAARYNGTDNAGDMGNAVITDASGNIYVTGTTTRSGNVDCLTIKYNSAGSPLWTSFYSGPGNIYDEANSIAVDASGNVYITGYSATPAQGNNYLTIKYNSSGVQQWASTYNYTYNDYDVARSIAIDASGNVYVTGESEDSTGFSIATVKYNSSGVQQWVRREWSDGHSAGRVKTDASGNVYIGGYVQRYPLAVEDYITMKYNSAGVLQWERLFNGSRSINDFGKDLAVDNSGNVYITGGGSEGGPSTGLNYVTVKYNSAGVQQWVAVYNGTDSSLDEAVAIIVDGSGNLIVTGRSREIGQNYNFTTVKYNSSGIQQWAKTFDGTDNAADAGISIQSDASGNIYVTGNTNIGSGSYDYATIKYSAAGIQQWLMIYNGPDSYNDMVSDIAVDGSGNVYVTGSSDTEENAGDVLTVKYVQTSNNFTLNASAIIQGFYNSVSNTMIGDTLKVILRNTSSPFLRIDSAKAVLNSSGAGVFNFTNAVNGTNYFIVTKHRNGLETWSKMGSSFTSGLMTYDFSSAQNKAYGDNQIQIDATPLKFAIYNGDVNQDGFINLLDVIPIYNDAGIFALGYLKTDVTGNNIIDLTDVLIAYNNSGNFVTVMRP